MAVKQVFILLLMSYILGLVMAFYLAFNLSIAFLLPSFLLVLILHLSARIKYQLAIYEHYAILLFFFLLGAYNLTSSRHILSSGTSSESYFLAQILNEPKAKDDYYTCHLHLIKERKASGCSRIDEKLLARIEKSPLEALPLKGSFLLLKASCRKVKASAHLYGFDYQHYLSCQAIARQVYVKKDDYKLIDDEKNWMYRISAFRQYLFRIYQQYDILPQSRAVLSALSLGLKDELDQELKAVYADNGVIHVLAVSGLHVGVIYLIISVFISSLPFLRNKKWLKLLVVLSFLSLYALLTGASPSVLRASLMFSLIAIGNFLQKQANIYNSIFSSAFILLLFNPLLLFNLSFQLSYIALLSIVFFQSKIESIYTAHFLLSRWLWKLISVSIAAQIGTLPISIYYFNQFPSYFIISNIVVIPFISIILWLSFFFFISHFLSVSFLAHFIVFLLNKLINAQILFLSWMASWPYSTIKHLFIDRFQLILLYVFLLFLVAFFIYPKKRFRFVVLGLLLLLGLFFYRSVLFYQHTKQKYLFVFSTRKATCFQLIKGRHSQVFADGPFELEALSSVVNPIRNRLGLREVPFVSLDSSRSSIAYFETLNLYRNRMLFAFEKHRFMHCSHSSHLRFVERLNRPLDLLIISKHYKLTEKDYPLLKQVKHIVVARSVSFSELKKWKQFQTSDTLKLQSIHLLKEQGDFMLNLEETF